MESKVHPRIFKFYGRVRGQEDSQNQSEEIVRVKAVTAQRASRQRAIEQQLQEVELLHRTATNKLQVSTHIQ